MDCFSIQLRAQSLRNSELDQWLSNSINYTGPDLAGSSSSQHQRKEKTWKKGKPNPIRQNRPSHESTPLRIAWSASIKFSSLVENRGKGKILTAVVKLICYLSHFCPNLEVRVLCVWFRASLAYFILLTHVAHQNV